MSKRSTGDLSSRVRDLVGAKLEFSWVWALVYRSERAARRGCLLWAGRKLSFALASALDVIYADKNGPSSLTIASLTIASLTIAPRPLSSRARTHPVSYPNSRTGVSNQHVVPVPNSGKLST